MDVTNKKNQTSIMIVEDEKIVANDIQRRLVALGYKVSAIFSRGEEAVANAVLLNPDIILMDIHLKGEMDGILAAEAIHKNKDIPIIYLTASTDDVTIQRAKITEPFGYLLKPFEVKDLKSCIEITVYKSQIDKKLKENEYWLNTTLSCIDEGVITTDANNNIKYINKLAEEILSLSADSCIGKPLDEIYKTNYGLSNELLLLGMSRNNPGMRKEINRFKNLFTFNNECIIIEETSKDLVNPGGEVIGKVVCFKDAREMVKLAIETITAKNYYLSLLEEFPSLIWRADINGRFNFFNRTWLLFRGKNIEDEINLKWIDGIHPDEREIFKDSFGKAFSSKNEMHSEFRLRNRYNEFKWIYCIAVPFYDGEQNFDGYIGACLDITERKSMESELIAAKVHAENSAKAKSEFISNISHEIKTPLNHIVGLSDLLLGPNLNNEQKEYINIIKKSGYALANTLNSILNFTSLDSGKALIKEVHFSLEKLLHDVIYSFLPMAKEKNILMDYFINRNITEVIIGDKEKLKDVLDRLLDNALKFTAKGRVCLEVFLENSNEDLCELHFVISDTGIGISPVELNIIFDPFTQVDGSATRKFNGAGLGLTIVKKTISLLDGKLWAESNYGKGSKFHFILKFKKSVRSIKNYV